MTQWYKHGFKVLTDLQNFCKLNTVDIYVDEEHIIKLWSEVILAEGTVPQMSLHTASIVRTGLYTWDRPIDQTVLHSSGRSFL